MNLFDQSKMDAVSEITAPQSVNLSDNSSEQRKTYTVSEITSDIKRSLDGLGILWVKGEISNFKNHSSGHMYFSLKDARAQIKAAFFRNNNMYLKFQPEDGMEVIARGRVSVYEPRGDYQIIVEYMEPAGLGSLQAALEQLKKKLREEGLFDEWKKKPLPMLPKKVGIVTSPTGAVVQDMLRVLKWRNASLDVLIYPARVQGAGASVEIAEGIRYLNNRNDIDVIIVGRGGGSIEALWAFNEKVVARAIYESAVPIISAVGHLTDFTLADFVADVRAPTPSVAAEMVSGVRDELSSQLHSLRVRLRQAVLRHIVQHRLTLERLSRNRAFAVARDKVRELQQRFDEASSRMDQGIRARIIAAKQRERVAATRLKSVDLRKTYKHKKDVLANDRLKLTAGMRERIVAVKQRERVAVTRLKSVDLRKIYKYKKDVLANDRLKLPAVMRTFLNDRKARFAVAVGKMDALSPLAILHRGYAICWDSEGRIVKKASAVRAGDDVRVKLADGEIECRVLSAEL